MRRPTGSTSHARHIPSRLERWVAHAHATIRRSRTIVLCLCARNVLSSSGVGDGLSVFEALVRRSTTIVEYMGMVIALRDAKSPVQSLPMTGPLRLFPRCSMTTALTHGPVQKLPYPRTLRLKCLHKMLSLEMWERPSAIIARFPSLERSIGLIKQVVRLLVKPSDTARISTSSAGAVRRSERDDGFVKHSPGAGVR